MSICHYVSCTLYNISVKSSDEGITDWDFEIIYKTPVRLFTFLFLLNTGNNQLVRLLENKRTSYNLHTDLKERDRL